MNKLLIALFYFLLFTNLHAKENIRVGIYQNEPKIFLDANNKPSGFFVDILDEIASQENWTITYVPCQWSKCLNMLHNQEIDIMPDVAYTKQREKRFLFSKEPVISSWSVLYRHKSVDIDSIFNLKNKKIAVLKDSIQSNAIKRILTSYSTKPSEYKEVSNYKEAFKLLASKKVDCVITNRFYELNHDIGGYAKKTNIVIQPSMIKFAFSFSKKELADKIDFYLKEFKKKPGSIYYKAEKNWITPNKIEHIPNWILWTVTGFAFVILFLILLVIIFQKMVHKKSQELMQKEELMIIQSRHAAMGEMVGMVAHQWRQPLSVLSMSANNLKLSFELEGKEIPQELHEHFKTIFTTVKYLSNTIDDFRDFFKPNKAKKEINISQLIKEIEKIFEMSLNNNDIEFIVHNNENFLLKTFPNELLQVILNLVNNAKDVLVENKIHNPKITLTTSKSAKDNTISVCDNGGGIPKDILPKIGKQYFTTKTEKGTGLGIYMSIIIVEQHLNGSLKWENIDDGACFTILLPN